MNSAPFVRVTATFALVAIFQTAGCAVDGTRDDTDSRGAEIAVSASQAVARARQWVDANLPYCQAPRGGVDPDDACWSQPWESGHRCMRASNAAWDPYRSDCSGLISWAWGLGAPGRTTWGFAPEDTSVSHTIQAIDLAPGDAVNVNASDDQHIMLFTGWVTRGSRATFIEEPGCSSAVKHAHEFTSDVTVSGNGISVGYHGWRTFHAIRFDHFGSSTGGSTGGCSVGGLYCGGDKVSGDANTLYRCTGGSSGTVVAHCASGCAVLSGQDDACRGSGGCVSGGLYCGGDKVTGDPSTLYKCTGGSSGTVVAHCASGCAVHSGSNDGCR